MKDYPIKAMVMSAGIGSRLEPLTFTIPKPLVPVANVPVMDILFKRLASFGINDVICNTYYLSDQITERYKNNNLGINFNYIKEDTLSGTAGGVKKCQFFFDKGETFVVFSADGLTNVDIKKGLEIHKKSNAVATIGIKQIPKEEVSHFGVVVTDKNGFITEFQEKPTAEEAKSNFINTGIYIFDYKIFDYIPENTFYDFAKNVFPKLLAENKINTFEVTEYWSDIGTLEQYMQTTKDLFEEKCSFEHGEILCNGKGKYISETENFPKTVEFVGYSTIGKRVLIGNNTIIENCIIWDEVKIGSNLHIKNSIIGSNALITRDLDNEVIGCNEIIDEQCEKLNT